MNPEKVLCIFILWIVSFHAVFAIERQFKRIITNEDPLLKEFHGNGKRFTENVRIIHSNRNVKMELKYDCEMHDMTTLLDRDLNVLRVQTIKNRLRLHLLDGNAFSYVPGNYIIIGEGWGIRKQPFFVKVVDVVQMNQNVFDLIVQEVSFMETFSDVNVDFVQKPHENVTPKQSPIKRFSWPSLPSVNLNPSYSTDQTLSMNLFQFNYNSDLNRARTRELNLFSGNNFNVICDDCFAYLRATVRFSLKFSVLHGLERFILEVGGQVMAKMDTTLEFQASYSENFVSDDFFKLSLSPIKFSVGPVPVYIRPQLALRFGVDVTATATVRTRQSVTLFQAMNAGIRYSGSGFGRHVNRGSPTFQVTAPRFTNETQGNLDVKLSIMPVVTLFLYDISPLEVVLIPYFRISCLLGTGFCGDLSVQYETSWGVDMRIQMQPFRIPSGLPMIGGTQYTLGNNLPFPKTDTATFTVIPERSLTCGACSGCVNLADVLDFFSREALSRFSAFASERLRIITAHESVSQFLTLGTDTQDEVSIEAGKCHLFHTNQILDSGQFLFDGEDARRVSITISAIQTNITVYYAGTSNPVSSKTAPSKFIQAGEDGFMEENFSSMYINVCAESSGFYKVITNPLAQIPFGTSTNEISIQPSTGLHLLFAAAMNENSKFNRLALSLNEMSGISDISITTLTGNISDSLIDVGKDFVQDLSGFRLLNFDVDLESLKSEMKDVVIALDILGRGSSGGNKRAVSNSKLESKLIPIHEANLDEIIYPEVEYVRIVSDSSHGLDSFFRYDIIVTKNTSREEAKLCVFTSGFPSSDEEMDECWTITEAEEELSFIPSDSAIESGIDYLSFRVDGIFSLRVDEYLSIESGSTQTIQASPESEGGRIFSLRKSTDQYQYERLVLSVIPEKDDKICQDCNYEGTITLFRDGVNLWVSPFSDNSPSTFDFNLNTISTELNETMSNLQRGEVLLEVHAVEGSRLPFSLTIGLDELTDMIAESTIQGRIITHMQPQFTYFHLPEEYLRKFDRSIFVRLMALESENGTLGYPQVYVQKSTVPRANDFLIARTGIQHFQMFGLHVDEGEDYYIGITTHSDVLDFVFEIIPLNASVIEVSFESIGKVKRHALGLPFLTDTLIRNYGFNISLEIHNFNEQSWNPDIMNPFDERNILKDFASHMSSTVEDHLLINHIDRTLNMALNLTQDSLELNDVVWFTDRKLLIQIPPQPEFETSKETTIRMSNLLPQYYSTRDSRNSMVGGTFIVGSDLPHFQFVTLKIILFAFLLICVPCCGIICCVAGTIFVSVLITKLHKRKGESPSTEKELKDLKKSKKESKKESKVSKKSKKESSTTKVTKKESKVSKKSQENII